MRPLDELHPQPDAPVDAIRAVDRDDVRMADAREQPPLVDHVGRDRIESDSTRRISFSATSRSSRESRAR